MTRFFTLFSSINEEPLWDGSACTLEGTLSRDFGPWQRDGYYRIRFNFWTGVATEVFAGTDTPLKITHHFTLEPV